MCGGGVDLNHTALTDLQQRLTAVVGSVGQVQQGVNPLDVPANVVVREVSFSTNGALLNVSGKGKLLCVGITSSSMQGDLNVNLDSKKILDLKQQRTLTQHSAFICQSCLITDAASTTRIITSFGNIVSTTDYWVFIDSNKESFSFLGANASTFISYKPIGFSSNLAVTAKNISENNTCKCLIAYTLDE